MKSQMKCHITCGPLKYTMDHPKFIVSNQKDGSTMRYRAKEGCDTVKPPKFEVLGCIDFILNYQQFES